MMVSILIVIYLIRYWWAWLIPMLAYYTIKYSR